MGAKTTGIQNLNMELYMKNPIYDAPMDVQDSFATIFEQADKSKFELRKSIKTIDIVIKSLINKK